MNVLLNLQLFCTNLSLSIDTGRQVQGGMQYEVSNGTIVVYVTLYNSGRSLARDANTDLLTLLRVWCGNTYLEGMLHPVFFAS